MKQRTFATIVIGLSLAAVVVAAAAASPAARRSTGAPELSLRWSAPTPANGKSYVVEIGSRLSVRIAAARGAEIGARGLPQGGALTTTAGGVFLTWVPTPATVGVHAVVITARKPGTRLYTAPRTLFLYGVPPATPASGAPTTLLQSPGVSRWAYVIRPALARTAPNQWAHVVTRVSTTTLDSTPNLVLLLASTKDAIGRTWYKIRLAIRPNNSTGWVLAGALGAQRIVKTYFVIDRMLMVATLYRNSAPVFRTRVGVGKPYWPTPRGNFYIREVLTGVTDPMYGPVAFGTSARSGVLTDWHGGGGVIGIHGTNRPEILPGRVSHGCVRMPNSAVSRLYRLMALGTPVAIR